MTLGAAAARLALLCAAWSAWRLTRVCPRHAPVAWALCAALALDLARLGARDLGAPVELLRVLYLGTPCASAWLAGAVLLRLPHLVGAICAAAWWGLSAAVLAGVWGTREAFACAAMVVACCAVAAQVAAGARCATRGAPTFTETCALVLAAGDLAGLCGAWRFPEPWRAWELNRWQLAVTLSVVGWVQWRRLRWTQTLAATSAPGSSLWARWSA